MSRKWMTATLAPLSPSASSLLAVALAATLATGCVSKSQFTEVEGQLATCEQEKAKADAAVISWEQRFDRESKRWTEMEKSVTTALPRALSEFQEERQAIVKLVPEQVRGQLVRYLDDYSSTVTRGFDRMKQDNDEIKLQLMATEKALQIVSKDTKAIDANTQSIGKMIDQSLSGERNKRESLAQNLTDLMNRIVEFDQTKINCKGCPERLKMRDKTKEEMLAFHQELMQDLATIQNAALVPPPSGGAGVPAADGGADPAGGSGADPTGGDPTGGGAEQQR
jgi:hypothetical protein